MKRKKQIAVGICIDESGSMSGLVKQTCDGFNEFINGLIKEKVDAVVTATLFDLRTDGDNYRDFCANEWVENVPKLTKTNYHPTGATPLFDAIGHVIQSLDLWLEDHIGDWAPTVVIMTDGYENASREFTRTQIFDMIQQKEKDGWAFVYLGANQTALQAEQAGAFFGMSAGSTMSYTGTDTVSAYRSASSGIGSRAENSALGSAAVSGLMKAKLKEELSKS